MRPVSCFIRDANLRPVLKNIFAADNATRCIHTFMIEMPGEYSKNKKIKIYLPGVKKPAKGKCLRTNLFLTCPLSYTVLKRYLAEHSIWCLVNSQFYELDETRTLIATLHRKHVPTMVKNRKWRTVRRRLNLPRAAYAQLRMARPNYVMAA